MKSSFSAVGSPIEPNNHEQDRRADAVSAEGQCSNATSPRTDETMAHNIGNEREAAVLLEAVSPAGPGAKDSQDDLNISDQPSSEGTALSVAEIRNACPGCSNSFVTFNEICGSTMAEVQQAWQYELEMNNALAVFEKAFNRYRALRHEQMVRHSKKVWSGMEPMRAGTRTLSYRAIRKQYGIKAAKLDAAKAAGWLPTKSGEWDSYRLLEFFRSFRDEDILSSDLREWIEAGCPTTPRVRRMTVAEALAVLANAKRARRSESAPDSGRA